MKQIGEIHTPNKNIKVKLISPKMKFDVTLLPQGNQGKYWRGTYKVKKGDTLSKIAKEHHTTVSALLALNPSIKSPNQIYQNQAIELGENNDNAVVTLDEHSVIKVPPAKKATGQVVSDRKATGNSSSSATTTPQAKQQTSTKQVEHKATSAQGQPSSTQSKPVAQKASQPAAAKKTSTAATTTTTTPQKIAVQQEHNENKKPVAVASLSGCVCKQYDIAWGKAVNCTFRKKVIQICPDMWPNDVKNMANNLMACMHLETRGTFDPKVDNGLGFYGLIQFGKDVRDDLGVTTSDLLKMTATQQLDLVKKHFIHKKQKYHEKMKSLTDMYLYINYPRALLTGKNNPNDILYQDNGKRGLEIRQNPYVLNSSFMKEKGEYESFYDYKYNKDGSIQLDKYGKKKFYRGFHGGKTYIWEVTQEIKNHLEQGELKINKENNFSCSINRDEGQVENKQHNVIISVIRKWQFNDATISEFTLTGTKQELKGYILEPAGPDTLQSGKDKRIVEGEFSVKWHNTRKNKQFGKSLLLYNKDVLESRMILIHVGNYGRDTEGCLLPGVSKSGKMVTGSGVMMKNIHNQIEDIPVSKIKVIIKSKYE